MSVALLIHRPPTPPQPADKSLSNRLHTSTAPLQPLNKKAQFSLSASQRVQNNSHGQLCCCCNHNNTQQNYTKS